VDAARGLWFSSVVLGGEAEESNFALTMLEDAGKRLPVLFHGAWWNGLAPLVTLEALGIKQVGLERLMHAKVARLMIENGTHPVGMGGSQLKAG
jgi:hypothetical protein